MIPVGKTRGILIINAMVREKNDAYVEKEKIRVRSMGVLKNDPVQKKAEESSATQKGVIFGLTNGYYSSFIPIHHSKNAASIAKRMAKAKSLYDEE